MPARLDRARAILIALADRPRLARTRAALDRFNRASGGLLAAGLSYNAVFALVPIAVLSAGLAGFILDDPISQARFIDAVVSVLPPLRGVIDEIVNGLAEASPSLSLIGLVLAAWGTSRLFASLDAAIEQIFAGSPSRHFVSRTIRRLGSVVVMAIVVVTALIVIPVLSVLGDGIRETGPLEGALLTVALVAVTVVLAGLALAAIYRVMPPHRPSWAAIRLPSAAVALGLLVLTRLFVILAPRLLGTNLVYGALGAIFVGLVWLDLVFSLVLVGAAWVCERSIAETTDAAEPPPTANGSGFAG